MEYDLLEEPIITIQPRLGGTQSRTLPGVLAALARAELVGFPALQVFQEHAWYAFLVQLAALARLHGGVRGSPTDEVSWKNGLRALTANAAEPWCLVVEDAEQPAFLQPPAPKGLAEFSKVFSTPDEIDVLVTAKNHDVKLARLMRPRPEHWAFALASIQTTGGYGGSGNYGVSRMNGGYGSRPGVSAVTSLDWSTRWRHASG